MGKKFSELDAIERRHRLAYLVNTPDGSQLVEAIADMFDHPYLAGRDVYDTHVRIGERNVAQALLRIKTNGE